MGKRKKSFKQPGRGKGGQRKVCVVPGCGRPQFAGGMCQTHRRQVRATGTTKPIRPYRKRTKGREKFAGLMLSKGCAETLRRGAEAAEVAHGAFISLVLEEWYQSGAAYPGKG